ncbi:16S rRNA (guanine(966)-N(2))-methyltransferase RsmD [Boudabousia marimammalium]|uniref:16S rRNA (Guanine(966)-N(2))-methyltransferase RsmD n=1 Tax=Boudabousia marimammalium TaxID=156892 RepID=A0A1Q5PR65_9ACTO|nr:16S rRNA (guanine(966)-N(2))-methyltransferase RsmD [Boudabousia marimammalium]OKL50121.1 16S rRNA (guanine(966)-N(2))-methyltransferase RsmD [Boudabousia marimammalium]
MTRIIAGQYKGRELKIPQQGTRPTSSRVREAIFSRLEHWNLLNDSRVVDLCAGSGALGLEAASRGARKVDLVEISHKAARVCQQNVQALGYAGARVHVLSAASFLAGSPHSCDVVFFDPPYDMAAQEVESIAAQVAAGWLEPHGVLVLERSSRGGEPSWPAALSVLDQKKYGETTVWYLELAAELPSAIQE